MVDVLNFYMDDSGTRHPDRAISTPRKTPDWFALGGIIVRGEDEERCRGILADFCERWGITSPLHSEEIRHRSKNFRWLEGDPIRRQEFLVALETMLLSVPVIGISCVIDRPGYHRRYDAIYGNRKWSLCKSAFAISVERASKYARHHARKLNVYVEKSDRKTDNRLKQHFLDLKKSGHPFDTQTSSRYEPLEATEIGETLYDFKLKEKSSPLMQIADLFLYPMCQGGYNPNYHPYSVLQTSNRLIDSHVSDVAKLGIKYYCFDTNQKTEAEGEAPSASGQPS